MTEKEFMLKCKNKKSLMWYYNPNQMVRLMRYTTMCDFSKPQNFQAGYKSPQEIRVGVVIGTYASVATIDLQLHFLKNVNGIQDILVCDDCSDKSEQLMKVCQSYGVDMIKCQKKQFYMDNVGSIGDQTCFYAGLQWAKLKGLDILVKFSRRLVACYRWIDDFKKLAYQSDGLTFTSYCTKDRFPFRTECVGMNVKAWATSFVFEKMMFMIRNQICVFAQFWMSEMAKLIDFQSVSKKYEQYKKDHFTGYYRSGYVHWKDLLGTSRYSPSERRQDVLWHMYSSPEDYLKKAQEVFPGKYSEKDFQAEGGK